MYQVFPNLITDTSTSLPHSMQLGTLRIDPDTGKQYQLLLTNSGLTQSPIAGTVMESISAANSYTTRAAFASGGAGSTNLVKGIAQASVGSATYYWGQIGGYCSGIQTVSGVFLSAGMTLVAASATATQSGCCVGVASGTAPYQKVIGFVSDAQASGAILFSGYLTIGA